MMGYCEFKNHKRKVFNEKVQSQNTINKSTSKQIESEVEKVKAEAISSAVYDCVLSTKQIKEFTTDEKISYFNLCSSFK